MYKRPSLPTRRPLVLTERGEFAREVLTGLVSMAAVASLFLLLNVLIGA